MEQTTASTGQQQSGVERSLQTTLERFNAAFNRFDAKEVASFWADDGTLLNPVGNYGEGRAAVERIFHQDAESILEGTTSTFTIQRARPVRADCVLLDLDHDVKGFRSQSGSTGPMKLHVVMLAQQKGDGWQWLDVRAFGFLQRPPPLH